MNFFKIFAVMAMLLVALAGQGEAGLPKLIKQTVSYSQSTYLKFFE